jgi:hypothetical protein
LQHLWDHPKLTLRGARVSLRRHYKITNFHAPWRASQEGPDDEHVLSYHQNGSEILSGTLAYVIKGLSDGLHFSSEELAHPIRNVHALRARSDATVAAVGHQRITISAAKSHAFARVIVNQVSRTVGGQAHIGALPNAVSVDQR